MGRPESHLDMGTVQSRTSPLQEGRERERGPDIPITTGELTQRMIGSGLKLGEERLFSKMFFKKYKNSSPVCSCSMDTPSIDGLREKYGPFEKKFPEKSSAEGKNERKITWVGMK